MNNLMSRILAAVATFFVAILVASGIIWLIGSSNPSTPAGYVGYITQGSILGKRQFLGTQVGPTSTGRTWLVDCINVSVTPYSYDELFKVEDGTAVLSKDHMQIGLGVHVVFQIRNDRIQDFLEHYSTLQGSESGDVIVRTAYENFLKERVRTFARDAIQQFDWQELTTGIDTIGKQLQDKVMALVSNTPFNVQSVVVGNIQFPASVAQSVAEAQAASQVLQRKNIEVQQAEADARKRVAEAKGVAEAMEIVQTKLTSQYLQHEAIEAQKAMVGSPNHTTIYIPVGPMGVPLVGTFDAAKPDGAKAEGATQDAK